MGQVLSRRHLPSVPPEHLRVEALTGRLDELEAAGWPPGALAGLLRSIRESAEVTTSRAGCWEVAQELAPPLLYGLPFTVDHVNRTPEPLPNTLRAMAAMAVAAALGHPAAAAALGTSCDIVGDRCIAEDAGHTCMGTDGCNCMELAGNEAAHQAAFGLLYELLEGVEGGAAVAAAMLPTEAAWQARQRTAGLDRRNAYRDAARRVRNRMMERPSSASGSDGDGGMSEEEEPEPGIEPFESHWRTLTEPGLPRELATAASVTLPTPLAFAAAKAACQLFPDRLRQGGGWLAVSLVKEVLGRPDLPPLLRLCLTGHLLEAARKLILEVCTDSAAVLFRPEALAACPALHVARLAFARSVSDREERFAVQLDAAQTLAALTEDLPATTFAVAGLANWLLGASGIRAMLTQMSFSRSEPARAVLAGLWDRLRPAAIDRAAALRTVGSAPGDWDGLNWGQGLVWQLAALPGVPWKMGFSGGAALLLPNSLNYDDEYSYPRLPLDVLARAVLGILGTASEYDLGRILKWLPDQLPHRRHWWSPTLYSQLDDAADDAAGTPDLVYLSASKPLFVLMLRMLMGEVRPNDAGAREAAVKECAEYRAAAYRVGLDIAVTMPLPPLLQQSVSV